MWFFGEFVSACPFFPFPPREVDKARAVSLAMVVPPPAKSSRHAHQMLLVEGLVGAGQIAPPRCQFICWPPPLRFKFLNQDTWILSKEGTGEPFSSRKTKSR